MEETIHASPLAREQELPSRSHPTCVAASTAVVTHAVSVT